jgi:hypothetical protein
VPLVRERARGLDQIISDFARDLKDEMEEKE